MVATGKMSRKTEALKYKLAGTNYPQDYTKMKKTRTWYFLISRAT